jgi:hypothetical protein
MFISELQARVIQIEAASRHGMHTTHESMALGANPRAAVASALNRGRYACVPHVSPWPWGSILRAAVTSASNRSRYGMRNAMA